MKCWTEYFKIRVHNIYLILYAHLIELMGGYNKKLTVKLYYGLKEGFGEINGLWRH